MRFSIKNRFCLVALITAFASLVPTLLSAKELADIKCKAASVLPFFMKNGERLVILGREAHGKDKGYYDDFGGGIESCERHVPENAAAREFFEEAILDKSTGLNISAVMDIVDPAKDSVEDVIVFSPRYNPDLHMVVYITDFHAHAQTFLDNYNNIRFGGGYLDRSQREKDSIATVKWEDLKNAIADTQYGNVSVGAEVINIDGSTTKQSIKLRRIFSSKMRPFFKEAAFETSDNKKIRFYSFESR